MELYIALLKMSQTLEHFGFGISGCRVPKYKKPEPSQGKVNVESEAKLRLGCCEQSVHGNPSA